MSEEGNRFVIDVGPGDFIKVPDGGIKQIKSNTAYGSSHIPKNWTVETTDGSSYGMYQIRRYYKAGDKDIFK